MTFGPAGRIIATIIVVVFFASLATASMIGIAYIPLYVIGAVAILRFVWARDEIDDRPKATLADSLREMREKPGDAPTMAPISAWRCPKCDTEMEKELRWCGTCKRPLSRAEIVERVPPRVPPSASA